MKTAPVNPALTTEVIENSVGLSVKRAILREPAEVPGGGGIESSLYAAKGVQMSYEPAGLICTYKGHRFLVPTSNLKVVWL